MKRFAVVTGTRRSSERLRILILRWLARLHPETVLIEGGATGADTIAAEAWRDDLLHSVHRELANWTLFGRKHAGPVRNAAMVAMAVELRARGWHCEGCGAFPDNESRGTWDCVRKLEASGFKVDRFEVDR